jgi:hypothetical protein
VAAVQPGVGILFIERILALNELLIALVLAARRSESAPLADLPFRWCVADQPLRFEVYDRVYTTARPAVLRPGAVIDLPRIRHRIFLEPELGTTSLAPADPRQGHVKRRIERYTTFFRSFTGRDMKHTWYGAAFPDGFYPEVFALARTEARRAKVERHIKDWFQGDDSRYALRAFTLAGAKATLTPHVAITAPRPTSPGLAGPPQTASTASSVPAVAPPEGGVRTFTVDRDLDVRLRSGMSEWVMEYHALRNRLVRHAERCPTQIDVPKPSVFGMNAFADLIWHRLLGRPGEPPMGWKL